MVLVSGAVATKPARAVAEQEPIVLADRPRFVSRGGEKLDAALERFSVQVTAKRCLDAGASTGGFTHCLLQRGAREVVALDVAHGKLDPRIREDSRVVALERTNIRDIGASSSSMQNFDLIVADLSFISLTVVIPALVAVGAGEGDLILLVKPQFEVGRIVASKGRGVVRDRADRLGAIDTVASALEGTGATIMGAMASPLLGPAGNAEFLLHATLPHASEPASPRGSLVAPLSDATRGMLERAVDESPDYLRQRDVE